MTLALDSGTADVVIKSADVALVRSCIQAQTLCVHDFNQVDNESCALQFSVGGKLELWNFWFGTGAYAAQAGGSDNIILGDSAGNPLAETVTVGTQFAVLTEGSGHTSYVMPARASRYLIAPWEGLTGREGLKGQLNTLDLGKATCLIKA